MLGILFSAVASTTTQAYEVSPLIMEIAPSGPGAIANIDISNSHDYRLILELNSVERQIDTNGIETEIPADDKFLIFPPQVSIEPRKSQRVQVRYIGPPLTSSEAFRVIIDQLPVKQGEGKTRLDLAYKFKTAVYVIPEDAAIDIQVTDVQADAGGNLEVHMENRGNRHAVLLSEPWSFVNTQGKTVSVDPKIIPGLEDSPLITAGGQRVVKVPASILQSVGKVQSVLIQPRR